MKSEKITNAGPKRRYNDACAAAHAMEILGERWALLVVRELMTGPKRFTDLRENLPGISANVLTQRLQDLEAAAVVVHDALPPPAAGKVYALTPWGLEAEPIFQALGRWAARSPGHDPQAAFSTASLVLSLRTMFAAGRTGGREARVGLATGRERHVARAGPGGIEVAPSRAPADLELAGNARTIAGLIHGGRPPEALEAAGALTICGDRALIPWFAQLFPLPQKAPSAAHATAATLSPEAAADASS